MEVNFPNVRPSMPPYHGDFQFGSFLSDALCELWRQIKIKRSPDEQPFKRVWELVHLDIVITKQGFIFLHVWGRGGLALDPL